MEGSRHHKGVPSLEVFIEPPATMSNNNLSMRKSVLTCTPLSDVVSARLFDAPRMSSSNEVKAAAQVMVQCCLGLRRLPGSGVR